MAEDEVVEWYHGHNGHELKPTPGDRGGQGGLVCCSPWGCKESSWLEYKVEGLASADII